MYLQYGESVLPGNTLLSATTKTHLLCISLLPKLERIFDPFVEGLKSTNNISPAAIIVVLTIRLAPSLYTVKTLACNSYFFRGAGKFIMMWSLADNMVMTVLIYLN